MSARLAGALAVLDERPGPATRLPPAGAAAAGEPGGGEAAAA